MSNLTKIQTLGSNFAELRLIDLVDNTRTDKNTIHSYLPLYDQLLESRKITAKNILEIGIQDGGSIKLWKDYFENAMIYGVDVISNDNIWEEIKNDKKIVLYTSTDAYSDDFIYHKIFHKKFDVIIDDGPHTLGSMIKTIVSYSYLLEEDGIMIIEDVQDWSWIWFLEECTPGPLKPFIEKYDLTKVKGRYDDIVFVINKKKI